MGLILLRNLKFRDYQILLIIQSDLISFLNDIKIGAGRPLKE